MTPDRHWLRRFGMSALLASVCCSNVVAQNDDDKQESKITEVADLVARNVKDSARRGASSALDSAPPAEDGDTAKLQYVVQFARESYGRIGREIADYTCIMFKRERVEGQLGRYQFMIAKIRHAREEPDGTKVPFSVYLKFLKPKRVKGREVLYVAGRDNGDVIARAGGTRSPNLTLRLLPTSPLAMEGNRYPITEIGFQTLAQRLIEVLEEELECNDGEVKIYRDARVDGRRCTHFQLTHHRRRENLRYQMAEVWVDDELGVPVYYRAYDWPREDGGKRRLLEEYGYKKIKTNVGLTDADFDRKNPSYHFKQLEDLPAKTDDP